MIKHISFDLDAWSDYMYWQNEDRKTLRRINKLLEDIKRNGGDNGIGKPEALKGDLSGCWSRRIDDINRLVYYIENDHLYILQCRNHY